MNHVLAVLALAAAFVGWIYLQRWTGARDALPCGRHGDGCGACGHAGEACSREPESE